MGGRRDDRRDHTRERWKRHAVAFDRQYLGGLAAIPGVSGALMRRFRQTAELILAMPERPTVLDLGCGVGRLCLYLAERGISCIGIDISSEALGAARRDAERSGLTARTRFIERDLLNLTDCPQADVWVALGVIDYFAEPERMLERLQAVPQFVCTIPRRPHLMNLPRYLFRTLIHGQRFWTYGRDEARSLLDSCGFTPTHVSRLATMWFCHNLGD